MSKQKNKTTNKKRQLNINQVEFTSDKMYNLHSTRQGGETISVLLCVFGILGQGIVWEWSCTDVCQKLRGKNKNKTTTKNTVRPLVPVLTSPGKHIHKTLAENQITYCKHFTIYVSELQSLKNVSIPAFNTFLFFCVKTQKSSHHSGS